jgi:hypothetical protein
MSVGREVLQMRFKRFGREFGVEGYDKPLQFPTCAAAKSMIDNLRLTNRWKFRYSCAAVV